MNQTVVSEIMVMSQSMAEVVVVAEGAAADPVAASPTRKTRISICVHGNLT